jgi:hypothetical protein
MDVDKMATIREYIAESVKTYEFKVKIAGDLPEGIEQAMKTALMKYDCASVSKGKRNPIQESPLDFPDMKNTHVTIFDVSCRYPTTSQVMTEYLADTLKIARGGIRVRNHQEEAEIAMNLEGADRIDTKGDAVLGKDYEASDNQDLVGTKRTFKLLKELGKKIDETDSKIGTTSPVGSQTTKFVDPYKGQK